MSIITVVCGMGFYYEDGSRLMMLMWAKECGEEVRLVNSLTF